MGTLVGNLEFLKTHSAATHPRILGVLKRLQATLDSLATPSPSPLSSIQPILEQLLLKVEALISFGSIPASKGEESEQQQPAQAPSPSPSKDTIPSTQKLITSFFSPTPLPTSSPKPQSPVTKLPSSEPKSPSPASPPNKTYPFPTFTTPDLHIGFSSLLKPEYQSRAMSLFSGPVLGADLTSLPSEHLILQPFTNPSFTELQENSSQQVQLPRKRATLSFEEPLPEEKSTSLPEPGATKAKVYESSSSDSDDDRYWPGESPRGKKRTRVEQRLTKIANFLEVEGKYKRDIGEDTSNPIKESYDPKILLDLIENITPEERLSLMAVEAMVKEDAKAAKKKKKQEAADQKIARGLASETRASTKSKKSKGEMDTITFGSHSDDKELLNKYTKMMVKRKRPETIVHAYASVNSLNKTMLDLKVVRTNNFIEILTEINAKLHYLGFSEWVEIAESLLREKPSAPRNRMIEVLKEKFKLKEEAEMMLGMDISTCHTPAEILSFGLAETDKEASAMLETSRKSALFPTIAEDLDTSLPEGVRFAHGKVIAEPVQGVMFKVGRDKFLQRFDDLPRCSEEHLQMLKKINEKSKYADTGFLQMIDHLIRMKTLQPKAKRPRFTK